MGKQWNKLLKNRTKTQQLFVEVYTRANAKIRIILGLVVDLKANQFES